MGNNWNEQYLNNNKQDQRQTLICYHKEYPGNNTNHNITDLIKPIPRTNIQILDRKPSHSNPDITYTQVTY